MANLIAEIALTDACNSKMSLCACVHIPGNIKTEHATVSLLDIYLSCDQTLNLLRSDYSHWEPCREL